MDQTIKVALNNVNSSKKILNNRSIYEFGVYTGNSMKYIINRTRGRVFSYIGFDSFEGFPEEKNDSYNYKEWKKGLYSAKDKMPGTPNEIATTLQNEFRKLNYNDNIFIKPLWFSDISFDPNIMKKAIFVNMDCCTYTSTCEAFDFLFKNDLIDEHTIFRFDDWGGTPEFLGGESKSLVDKCKEYHFDWSITLKRKYGGPHTKTLVKLTPQNEIQKDSPKEKEDVISEEIKEDEKEFSKEQVDIQEKSLDIQKESPKEHKKETLEVLRELKLNDDIYLTFIVSGRNDNYGGNYIYRLQNFISSIQIMSDHFKLKTQTVIVEWNPILTNAPLKNVIYSDSKYNKVTIITVPFEFHKTLPNKSNVPIHDYVGKNVGIVRAEGEYILVCSGDLIFSKELFEFFNSNTMKPGNLYRNTRIDFRKFTDERISPENFDWFINNVHKKHISHNTFNNSRKGITVGNNIPIVNKYFCDKSGEYTNGCGDFLLMSKKDWMEIKGCVSDSNYFSHLDSATLHKALRKFKKRQITLHPSLSIFHMDHGRPHVGKDRRQPSVNYNVESVDDWGFSKEEFEMYHTPYINKSN